MRALLRPLVKSMTIWHLIDKKYTRTLYFGLADDSTTLKNTSTDEKKETADIKEEETEKKEQQDNEVEKKDLFYDI